MFGSGQGWSDRSVARPPFVPKPTKSVLGHWASRCPSQFADRQQPVLQRFVLPELGCLAAERDASAFEYDGILGKSQRKIDLLLGEDHRNSGVVADRPQRGEQVLDDDRRQTLQRLVEQQDLGPADQRPRDSQHLLFAAAQPVAGRPAALREQGEQRKDAVWRPTSGQRRDLLRTSTALPPTPPRALR